MAKNLFPLIAKRIDSIPTLPLTLRCLATALRRDDVSTEEIVDLVEADPALTAKVLKVINSPFYGLRFKVSTLSHAVAMLGRPALRHLAGGIASFAEDVEEVSALDKSRLWLHGFAVGTAARAIAVETDYDIPEEAYIAGLLHDLGKIILDLYAPDVYREIITESGPDANPHVDLERSRLGMDHTQVGALVADQWNLPKILKDVIQFHHEPPERLSGFPRAHQQLVAIVSAADRLCRAYGMGASEHEHLDGNDLVLHDGETLSPDQADTVLESIRTDLHRISERFGIAFDTEGTFLEHLREANADAAREKVPSIRLRLEDRISSVSDVIRRSRRAESVEEVLEIALHSAQQSLGLDRILYLGVDLDEEILAGKHFYDDTHIEVDVNEIAIPLNPDGLVGTAIRSRTAHLVDNWATDGELLRYLGVVEVAAAPVVVNEQPYGIICGDTFFRNKDISESDVALLGILATDLSLSIENHVLSRQSAKLQALASKDELTGVHNRRSLMNLLQKEIDRARRYGSPLSAVMIDVDHFKMFNDNYGHLVGDEILREVAQLIVSNSREIDVIGRYGGEEFTVVLPETDIHQATVYAERVRSSIEQLGRERRRTYPLCHLSISIGVSSLLKGDDDIEGLIHRVDHALYAAKDRGRNRVCVD